MRRLILSVGSACVLSVGASNAVDILIPYVKSGGNWVSLVGYVTQSPNYLGKKQLHFIYWYKTDWSGFDKIVGTDSYAEKSCSEYNDEVPATENDFTTVDISASNKLGLTDSVLGKEEGYDGGLVNNTPTAPTNADFTLKSDKVVDAYLVIQDGNVPGDGYILAAEAVVLDTVTGMFFYQFGINMQKNANMLISTPAINRFSPTNSVVMFQGEDFASSSVYYIPVANYNDAINQIIQGNSYACMVPQDIMNDGGARVYNRMEDGKSGLNNVCVKCLALVPVKYFMSDSAWNRVKNGGGWFAIRDGFVPTDNGFTGGGVTYKGEVYKIGTKPNIFAPLKSYGNSLSNN